MVKNLNVYFCRGGEQDWEGGVLVSAKNKEQAKSKCIAKLEDRSIVKKYPPRKLNITTPRVIYVDETR